MQEYRGIKLSDECKYKNIKVQRGLDALADRLVVTKHQLLSEFVNQRTKILIDFKCGHEPNWVKADHYVNSKSGCPHCNRKEFHTAKENFRKLVKSNGHTLLGKYLGMHSEVLIDYHCEHEPSEVKPYSYIQCEGRCPNCSNTKIRSMNKFITLLEENGHTLVGEYIDNGTKVLIDYHCGHDPSENTPHNYISNNTRCPRCSGTSPQQAKEDFMNRLQENGHKLLSEYVDTNFVKVLINFNCGHEPHWLLVASYKQGQGCPRCAESKGEKIIKEWLGTNGIEYKSQYRIDGARYLYDIYLPKFNLIVEVQGQQHFNFIKLFHKDEEGFRQEKLNDLNKQTYAENNGNKYMAVDYRESKPHLALERFKDAFSRIVS